MNTSRLTLLGITGALLLGSAVAQAEELDSTVDQSNQVWSMQGVQDGSYTGTPVQAREQKRIREQKQLRTRARVHSGDAAGSRYGRGYESRVGNAAIGPGAGGAGGAGGQGGGRR